MIKGIDVSHWQSHINFEKVKEAGIEFVILKAGGSDKGFYKDSFFEEHYERAKAAGLKVGAYYFVGHMFYGRVSGEADAMRFLEIIKDKQFDFPVFVDIETTSPAHKDLATEAAISFCETMESAGYFVGIYASDISGFKERLYLDRLRAYTMWVANYSREPTYVKEYAIWQHSSKGSIPGVAGNVDLNLSKTDFAVIREKNFNGFYNKEETHTKAPKRAATKRRKSDEI